MSELTIPGVTFARANWGRWIADCPSPHCTSALMMRRGATEFCCWDCGTAGHVVWPVFAEDVEVLLTMRPDEKTRNWEPGETLHDLLAENLTRGVLPPIVDALQGGPVIGIVGDRITHLHDEFTTPQRLAVGG